MDRKQDSASTYRNGYIPEESLRRVKSNNEESSCRNTFFAPSGRAMTAQLYRASRVVESNPVTDLLMKTYGGVLAILNKHRQIVAVNDVALRALGVDDPNELLGLRPGEAVNCMHAQDGPDGCGTGKACRTCGAVLAIVASQTDEAPQERDCYISVRQGRRTVELEFLARAVPIQCREEPFTVLMLQDISDRKRRESLERTFFHDVHNTMAALKGTVDLMVMQGKVPGEIGENLSRLTLQVLEEMDLQRDMNRLERGEFEVQRGLYFPTQILNQVRDRFRDHALAGDRTIRYLFDGPEVMVHTSLALASRVLSNMVLNALEATPAGGRILVWWTVRGSRLVFKVWNEQSIPPEVARRVFERNYTTKPGRGRGTGTYGMKLLSEEYLDGEVCFVTSPLRGTMFRFALPVSDGAG